MAVFGAHLLWGIIFNGQQLSLAENEIVCHQRFGSDAPRKLLRFALIARPATINLLDSMLTHYAGKLCRRRQCCDLLLRVGVWMATFIEAAAATGVAAGVTNVRQ